MALGAVHSKGVTALCIVVLATACGGAAIANPVPPAYLDFPIAPSAFVSQVPAPVLADDFEPGLSGMIGRIEWWGSRSDGPWELTLYSNADPDPTAPDDGGASAFIELFEVAGWEDDTFHYTADVSDLGWMMTKGESNWLSVASFEDGWTWALGDGERTFGSQRRLAVGSLDIAAWEPLDPSSNLAFGVWPTLVPEPGIWILMVVGVLGLGLSYRWRLDSTVTP